MKRLVLAAVATAALTLGACATPTPYGPAAQQKGEGYSEQKIEAGRYRVTFTGVVDAQTAQDRALRRAAELALADNYDWFTVVSRAGSASPNGGGPRMSLGLGGNNYGYGSSLGLGLGTSFNLGRREASATLEVLMGRGPKPDQADAYDARGVIANIRA